MRPIRILFTVLSMCLLVSCSHSQNLADSTNAGCYPLPGAKVISPYKNNRGSHRHSGVDLKTKPNDPIYAVYDGVVTMSKSYYGYGKCELCKRRGEGEMRTEDRLDGKNGSRHHRASSFRDQKERKTNQSDAFA